MVFTSIAGLRTDISQLTPLDLLVGFVPNALIAWRDRKNACFRIWGPLALMVLAGDIPGALLLKYGDAHILKIGFGVLVILLALDMLLQREKKPIGKVPSILLGIVAGLVCGMYGVGALAAAYVSRATDSNESYRGSLCIVFTLDTVHPISAAGIDFRQVLVQLSGKNESLIQPRAMLFKVGFAHPAIAADTLLGSFWKFKIREIIVSVKGIMNAVFDDFLFQRCHGDDLLCHDC